MSEYETSEARKRMAEAAKTATDEEIDRLSSAIHIGLTVLGMIDSIGQSREVMEKMGLSPEEGQFASSTILGHRSSGNLFQISVTTATEEDAAAHQLMMAEATDLDGEGMTKH
jgi:hypothetical protein